jgi:hypothetical protein
MKKIFGLLIIICSCLTLNAQIIKGSILLGGQIFYYNSNINYGTTQPNQKNKSGDFNISAGKALKENSVLGFYVTYGNWKANNNYNGNYFINSKVNQYNFGLFYRQYKNLARDFYFFAEAGVAYISAIQTDTDTLGNNKVKYTQSGGQLNLTPGISYKIFKKLQLEIFIPSIVSVQYTISKTKSQTNNFKQEQFLISTNLNASSLNNLGVGFRFVL